MEITKTATGYVSFVNGIVDENAKFIIGELESNLEKSTVELEHERDLEVAAKVVQDEIDVVEKLLERTMQAFTLEKSIDRLKSLTEEMMTHKLKILALNEKLSQMERSKFSLDSIEYRLDSVMRENEKIRQRNDRVAKIIALKQSITKLGSEFIEGEQSHTKLLEIINRTIECKKVIAEFFEVESDFRYRRLTVAKALEDNRQMISSLETIGEYIAKEAKEIEAGTDNPVLMNGGTRKAFSFVDSIHRFGLVPRNILVYADRADDREAITQYFSEKYPRDNVVIVDNISEFRRLSMDDSKHLMIICDSDPESTIDEKMIESLRFLDSETDVDEYEEQIPLKAKLIVLSEACGDAYFSDDIIATEYPADEPLPSFDDIHNFEHYEMVRGMADSIEDSNRERYPVIKMIEDTIGKYFPTFTISSRYEGIHY